MLKDTTGLKKGETIRFEKKIWTIIDTFFVSPGKGSAFFRTKLKDISSGKQKEHTFKSGESIEFIETERRNATYLYQDNEEFVFMEDDTFEQYSLDINVLGNLKNFLKEEQKVIIFFAENSPINISFPKTKVSFKVIDAPPAIKGDTVSSSYRPITIETGAIVQVPLFIKENDEIIVNVETGEYSERAKK